MALSRNQKEEMVAGYDAGFARAPHAFLVGFRGVTVPQVTDLRERIRQSGGHYLVIKNTLARRAVEGKPLAELAEQFSGPTAIAYSDSDPVVLAKVLTDFVKEVPTVEFKGGLVESRPVAATAIRDIANLPSREQLIAKLLFLLQSPITRLARGLAAIPQQLVVVLEQVRQQKEGKV